MEIREYRKTDLDRLFGYWSRLGRQIPYVFPVSADRWQTCLLEDELDGEPLFSTLETVVATDNDQVRGFVQYGQPRFAWDESGKRYANPQIGVIRQLYFQNDRGEVGEALLARAEPFLARFRQSHAFYHILGMSCTAHHGKLHHSQRHVHRLLRRHGFRVEHENIYFVLDMESAPLEGRSHFRLRRVDGSDGERFEMRHRSRAVATAHVRLLDALTDGCADDTAYLCWIGVDQDHRGRGIGSEFMGLLAALLAGRGYRYIHTDTPAANLGAQRFYESLGFRREGRTRSYLRPRDNRPAGLPGAEAAEMPDRRGACLVEPLRRTT